MFNNLYMTITKSKLNIIFSPQGTTVIIILSVASPYILGLKLGKLPKFLTFSQHLKFKKKGGRHQREARPIKRLPFLLLDLSV